MPEPAPRGVERVKALPVAIATSPPEAAALVAALESAAIPALAQNTPRRGYGMEKPS